ncbi:unnamed protein product [Prunus armeniaca]
MKYFKIGVTSEWVESSPRCESLEPFHRAAQGRGWGMGLLKKSSSSGLVLPRLGVGPMKTGWPEGQLRPRGDDVMRDVIARFQIFLPLARAIPVPTVKKI